MQHTDKYQLDLIETSDTFSPAPLNENMQKVEAQFIAEAAARQSGDDGLDQRVQALEARRIVVGSYVGDGASHRTISLGFTPVAILLVQTPYGNFYMATQDHPYGRNTGWQVEIVDGGFHVPHSDTFSMNRSDGAYGFLAIL